jgi:hypothetical protein
VPQQVLVLTKEYFDKSRIGDLLAMISEERDPVTGHVKRKYKGAPPRENCTFAVAFGKREPSVVDTLFV